MKHEKGRTQGKGRARFLLTAALGLLTLAGCATHVQNTANYAAPTGYPAVIEPRPALVLVYPFGVNPAEVQLPAGVPAKLEAEGQDPAVQRAETAETVRSIITNTLVDAFSRMGLPARPAYPGERPPPGAVIVQGQIVKINAGNATRRALIGFGAGQSQVEANVGVSRALPNGMVRILETYYASATSGRTPGLGLGAASAAAGHVAAAVAGATAGTVARSRTGLEKEAQNLAQDAASDIGQFFVSEGWIAPE